MKHMALALNGLTFSQGLLVMANVMVSGAQAWGAPKEKVLELVSQVWDAKKVIETLNGEKE